MARITVEDCIVKIPNRFELVLSAAQRARDVSAGAPLTVERDNDKNPVVALREIADETVDKDVLHESLIQSLQRHREQDEPEDEDPDLLSLGEGLGLATAEEALGQERSLVDQEIADELRTLGEEAVEAGAEIAEAAEVVGGGEAEAESEAETEAESEDSTGGADEED